MVSVSGGVSNGSSLTFPLAKHNTAMDRVVILMHDPHNVHSSTYHLKDKSLQFKFAQYT